MSEIWKDIKDYEGLYQVSTLGRIRSKRRRGTKGGIIRSTLDKKNTNYYKIRLCKNGHFQAFFIHRLVAQTFIPNPKQYPQVNHKDENRHNNYVENLEWCTNQYNANYGNCKWKGSISRRKGLKWVCQYSMDGKKIGKYKTLTDAARAVNGFPSNISKAIHGEINTAYGFKWKSEN
ncbi:NUMOD4 domain-containing protein [Ligilactobacillus saerimneri]|uniref:NUMOD4 domain-containing protein n=1 Tax=Ligilactobacillus saerimneri TaxID=228229 RepID=UPI000416B0A6|nr:NUMOD4 domain-containing protein [Ligilactobacillus saerimneri]